MAAVVSSLSKEYLTVTFEILEGGREVNTGGTVEFAIIADGEPVAEDWQVGEFAAIGQDTVGRILIGPGTTLPLTDGTYTVWVRLTQTPEIIVRPAGPLIVT